MISLVLVKIISQFNVPHGSRCLKLCVLTEKLRWNVFQKCFHRSGCGIEFTHNKQTHPDSAKTQHHFVWFIPAVMPVMHCTRGSVVKHGLGFSETENKHFSIIVTPTFFHTVNYRIFFPSGSDEKIYFSLFSCML